MYKKYNIEERCRKILEDKGGIVADRARTILLEDPILKDLRPPLEFISKNWRDPLTPALMSLSCEAVGGRSDKTHEAAIAISLMHLTFYIWDDMIDRTAFKSFKPTILGKFGESTSLIVGGLAAAKAFSLLNQMSISKAKHQIITKLVWDLWAKMAKTETAILRVQQWEIQSLKRKKWKIKSEASDMETCLKIGAIIGNGSESEINHLGEYGRCLGVILALMNDFRVSINLTIELAERVRSGKLTYSLLWARSQSEKLGKKLDRLRGQATIEQTHIKEIVEELLATRALDHTKSNLEEYAKQAKKELTYLNENNATLALRLFADGQPGVFAESLST